MPKTAFEPVLVKDDPLADRRALPPFAALRAFEAVGRLGGVRRAAQALQIDHAVVSRHVRGLEAWLGVALVDRSRGGGMLTPDGQGYHARISRAINEIAESTADLMRRGDESVLRLSCVPGLASEWLAARIALFQDEHPELEIELHPTDATPRFGRQEADVDIRYLYDPQPAFGEELRSVEIARPEVFAVASRALLEAVGPIGRIEDFLSAPLLHEESSGQWTLWLQRQGLAAPSSLQGIRLWHAHLAIEAARRGRGIALANALLVGDDLETGRLERVQPPGCEPQVLGAYVLICRADRWRAPAVAAFRRWIEREIVAQT